MPVVRRPRLEAVLDAGEDTLFTLVCGPAGAGTTSLLLGWAERVVADRGPGAAIVLTAASGVTLAELTARLAERPDRPWPLTVVVDDLDDRDEEAIGALVDAAQSGRDRVRLVLGVEQHRLSLPSVRDGQGTVVGPGLLWFTPPEAEALVRSRFPGATDRDLTEAEQLGEGWASAVVAAARAITRARQPGDDGSAPHEVTPDLRALDEVAAPFVESLPADERATLLAVGAHDPLERDDVLALTGSAAALDHLATAADVGGLVTVPSGLLGGAWRLHPVLRQYLGHQTSGDGPERAVAVQAHRRALQYFGSRGERVRAVQHAAAGRDPDTIVEALMEHGPSLVAELHEDVFDAAVAALPDDVAESEPLLVAVRGVRHRMSGSVSAGLRDAARLAELDIGASGQRSQRPRSALHAADRILLTLWEARYGLVEPGDAVASATALLTGVDPGEQAGLCAARRSWLSFELGAVNLWLGDVSEATLWIERGMTVAEIGGSPRLLAGALAHRSLVEVVDGAYAAAGESARSCLLLAASSHLLTDAYTARAHVAAACASYARLEPEAAWDHLESVEQMPPGELDPTVLTLARVARGRLLTLQGDHERAWGVLSGRSVRRADLPRQLGRLVAVARAELAVARWDASAVLRETQVLDDLGYPEDAALFRSVAAMSAEDFPGASTTLAGLLRSPATLPVTGAAAAACLVRLALMTGGAEAARPLVPDLLSRVATGSSDVLLVVAAGGTSELADLLGDEASLPDGHPYAATAFERLGRFRRQQTAAASRQDGDPGQHTSDAVVGALLTDRETAVLSCLQDGKTYEDIGYALFITPNTVKTHVQSLYRKLGVERAGQAVRRGRELGLLPPS